MSTKFVLGVICVNKWSKKPARLNVREQIVLRFEEIFICVSTSRGIISGMTRSCLREDSISWPYV